MNGHDGICATCGEIVLPSVAVQHFGVEVLTATPQQRIDMLHERKRFLHESYMAGEPIPQQRSVFQVERELRQYGIDTSFRSCQPTPVLDVLAAVSRSADRGITRFIRWAMSSNPRRPVRKTRRK